MKISVVIPAYNEVKRIGNVLEDLRVMKLPVIVIDDGSKDKTSEVARNYPVTLVRHKINLGKGAALKTGCLLAFSRGAEGVIMMDSDGQHKVSDLDFFKRALEEDNMDIVFGSRNLSLGVPFVRFMGNKFASVLLSVFFGVYVSDAICGFRALSKKAFYKIDWQMSGYGVETEMVVKTAVHKLRHCEVPVETVYYDKFKGVTILDALSVLFSVIKWRIFK